MGDAPRAIVIGSGIGGAVATLLLAHAGVPTVLLEKNRRVGGSCSGYEKHGFKIDIGTHMFCRGPKGPLGDVLRRVGEDGAIEFRRTRDIAELRFPERAGVKIAARDGVARLPVPASIARVPRFAFDLARALGMSALDAARAARLFARILTMSEADVAALDGATIEEFLAPYVDHAPTIGIFGFLLGLYFILPYWEVSAGEAIWSFQRMALDNFLSYPRGGSIAIPSTYVKLAQARGADVRTDAGVKRVVVRDGRVAGVELTDGTFVPGNVVISTSSVRSTVRHLVGPQHFPTTTSKARRRFAGRTSRCRRRSASRRSSSTPARSSAVSARTWISSA